MKFKNYGLPVNDLVQEGHIGLMQAMGKFEPNRDIRFSTYASWWIRSAIQDYVLKNYADFYRNKVCYETLRAGNLYTIRPVSCLFEHYDVLVLISKTKEVEND